MQSPRFVTQPSASASIVSEGRAKFLQCQAVGELLLFLSFSQLHHFLFEPKFTAPKRET
jgi:hypothetical protein